MLLALACIVGFALGVRNNLHGVADNSFVAADNHDLCDERNPIAVKHRPEQ